MAVYSVPEAAIDAAEKTWYERINAGIITPPRDHIEALLRSAAPHMTVVAGEVVPNAVESEPEFEPTSPPVRLLEDL